MIIIIAIVVLIGLLPPKGVIQKVKVYGNAYHVKTVVWYKGKPVKTWFDTFVDDHAYNVYKKNVKKEAQELYKSLRKRSY